MFIIYPYESINIDNSIKNIVTKYYDKVMKHKKMTNEMFNKIINDYEIKINDINITNDNKEKSLEELLILTTSHINILLQRKTIRDLDGYNNMINLLSYLIVETNSYNIISGGKMCIKVY